MPSPTSGRTESPADLVLLGGSVVTMNSERTVASAVAVRGGRIVAVGGDRAVRAWIGPGSRVVELRGRTVTPGFGDAHVHPISSGLDRLRCDLDQLRGLDDYLAAIATYAATHSEEPWIRGGGWSMADFAGGIPHRADLDRVVPDRPVFLTSRDGHTAWVNSRALELADITADTQDPVDGRIERDADGAPSGALQEGAIDIFERLLPANTPAELEAALRLGQAELIGLGITHWQDAAVTSDEELAYTTLANRGDLTVRVVAALWWERSRDAGQIDELIERRARTATDRYAPTSVKLLQDGVLENRTGALLEPYVGPDGRETDVRGSSQIDPDALCEYVTRLDALGFQAHFHAIGDRAIREALDAVEAARSANGPSDTRPHIAHLQVVHPDDIGRFRELGVFANVQAYWAVNEEQMDRLTIPLLGPRRTTWQYPFASLLASGATLAMGSDWSVSTADPLLQMEVAVTRVSDNHRGQEPPFLPEQRIELIDALAGFTNGSATVNHLDNVLGSIELGKSADLVVLDRNLFDRAEGAIGEARVVATVIDGVVAHERPDLGG